MTTGLVIFARFDSVRLPGKALADIAGQPLLGHVINRARVVAGALPIVVATTDRDTDDPIVAFAREENVEVFRGALNDVADRALECADAFGFDAFARICGDRPFYDPVLLGDLIEVQARRALDLVTNAQQKTYPPGLTAEVVATAALRRVLAASSDPEDREHVTRYFYTHPESFRIVNVVAPQKFAPDLSLVVDTPNDLERARWIAGHTAGAATAAPVFEITSLAEQWEQRRRTRRLAS